MVKPQVLTASSLRMPASPKKPSVASSGSRDFLKESLLESRKLLALENEQIEASALLSQFDKKAIQMMQIQKPLEGIAVLDTEKAIQNFKSNSQLSHDAAPKPVIDYNLAGTAPKLAQNLANKYLKMRYALKQ